MRDTPPYRAIPFRDSIAEGGIARALPCFRTVLHKYRWDTHFGGGGYRTSTSHSLQGPRVETLRKGGGGTAPNWPCWDTKNPTARNRLGRDMGECKTYGGRKTRSPENFWTPPKELLVCSFVDFYTAKTEHWTWGGWKTYRTRGGRNPLFGRGAIHEVFHPPLFSTPHGVLWIGGVPLRESRGSA